MCTKGHRSRAQSLRSRGDSTNGCAQSSGGPVEFVDFVAQTVPVSATFARKQFEIRTAAIAFDAIEKFIRLAGMFAHRRDDHLAYVLRVATRIAASAE